MNMLPMTSSNRHILPTRRLAETREVRTADGRKFFLSVGYDPAEPDRPLEVFYSAGFRSGSALEFQVQDTCVLISLLLQNGYEPEMIAKSLARHELPDGSIAHASLTGLILEELAD